LHLSAKIAPNINGSTMGVFFDPDSIWFKPIIRAEIMAKLGFLDLFALKRPF